MPTRNAPDRKVSPFCEKDLPILNNGDSDTDRWLIRCFTHRQYYRLLTALSREAEGRSSREQSETGSLRSSRVEDCSSREHRVAPFVQSFIQLDRSSSRSSREQSETGLDWTGLDWIP